MVLLLNYSHPFTPDQQRVLAELLGEPPEVRAIPTNVDRARPLAEMALELADAAGLAPDEWQTTPLVVNPPGLAPLAAALLAEIHGRCGGFPALLNVRPAATSTPTRYEIAEVVNLQSIREAARGRR
jgi:hypothetical protein